MDIVCKSGVMNMINNIRFNRIQQIKSLDEEHIRKGLLLEAARMNAIYSAQYLIQKRNYDVSEQEEEIRKKDSKISELEEEIKKKDAEISEQEEDIRKKDAEISNQGREITEKDARIKAIKEKHSKIMDLTNQKFK